MDGYGPSSYGDHLAASYDEVFDDFAVSEDQIQLLAELAGTGTAVELGVGTGRVAVPLARAGVSVIGLDVSERMLAVLRGKAAGLPVTPILADAADFRIDTTSPISLVYAVFNTFFMLSGRESQASCLRRVGRLLCPGGALVVELFVPRPERFAGTDDIRIKSLSAEQVILQVSRHNATAQRVDSQDIRFRDCLPVQLFPTQVHYLRPDQLDELMTDHGFSLAERYADWDGVSFSPTASKHISVYRNLRGKDDYAE